MECLKKSRYHKQDTYLGTCSAIILTAKKSYILYSLRGCVSATRVIGPGNQVNHNTAAI